MLKHIVPLLVLLLVTASPVRADEARVFPFWSQPYPFGYAEYAPEAPYRSLRRHPAAWPSRHRVHRAKPHCRCGS